MSSADGRLVKVELRGDREHLPNTAMITEGELESGRLKIPSRGGHEHFVRDDSAASSDGAAAVFVWCDRTKIAE